ncbi:MAG: 2-succinyl-5-enolpyruvyl-6-hydroxy-3-cyclohexene-1-carboxylic-acid synthase [Cyclobacteriaceae bacterium]|nr:2-succinyl-5-enolpyruvyl-6-hydroxy-3-cyclohexene-1-carboxylic-acid synthase [Cyclobacteriaceae bacterium]UYN85801.1 MAG: 2-succinyl-5-enolpyruvyl-6-hydroxy-3-cyclohexene-1-carboxylic-acid synthase [Cyclobacteriaceae bacterium]
MTRFQPIYDLAELCARKGLKHVVLSPGSRCAPLTLAFTRHPQLNCKIFSDERTAAFTGLGMAQQTKQASVLLCTSGTAVYNFAPAVAEACFSKTPLLIFTADRPTEWIGQQDGQTIYQENIFGKHVKRSFQLPQDYEHPDSMWAINRIVNEAINEAHAHPQGPVHINAPFREPLYPNASEDFTYTKSVRTIEPAQSELSLAKGLRKQLAKELEGYNKVLMVAGQQTYHEPTAKLLEQVCRKHNLPLAGDVISNLHLVEDLIRHADLFLGQATDEIRKSLQPELLITFGESVISKNLKLFLRQFPAQAHWHIQPAGIPADSFQSLTRIIHTEPAEFFNFLDSLDSPGNFGQQKKSNYQKLWSVEEWKTERLLKEFFPQENCGELELVKEILQQLPSPCNLHLANSMSVRYANFIGLTAAQKGIEVFSNRGTSGIDGCTSTAVGHSLATESPTILITGDMAFFYDRNAFWHNYLIPNFRAVVLNNHGGTIFNLIDGPAALPEAGEYFVTRQTLSAKKLCEEFGFDYLKIDNKRKIKNTLKDFFDFDGSTKILELETEHELNKTIFEELKKKIKLSYES